MTLIPPCDYARDERGNQTIMNKAKRKHTLSQSATYQIKVPGHFDKSWSEWVTPDSVIRPREEWIAVDTPAIISSELWQRAQDQRMHNQRFSQRNNHQQVYLLRGLMVCGVCDGLMIVPVASE